MNAVPRLVLLCDDASAKIAPVSADCQIDECGVPAVGRCRNCSRAFCVTHQGRVLGGPVYVDRCEPCTTQDVQRRRDHDEQFGPSFVHSGRARTVLATAGVPTVEIHTVEQHLKVTRLTLRVKKQWTTSAPFGHGWLLGDLLWQYNAGGPGGGSDNIEHCLTALLRDPVPDKNGVIESGLVRVAEDADRGGYILLKSSYASFSYGSDSGWSGVAAKVRQLAG